MVKVQHLKTLMHKKINKKKKIVVLEKERKKTLHNIFAGKGGMRKSF